MKKLVIFFLTLSSLSFSYVSAYSTTINGDVITRINENEQRPLASLTKLMNIAVAMDYVNTGKASLDEMVEFNSYEANMNESSLRVKNGDKIKLEDLLKAEIVYSANNAAYAVARHLAGSYDAYVEQMNEKAKEIGMKDTYFYSVAGLPTSYTNKPLDVSTAKEISKLAKYLYNDKNVIEWASLPYVEIKGIKYNNRNKNLGINGNFGLKTGYHSMAMYNMIGINKINNVVLVNVTLGDDTEQQRISSQNELATNFKDSFSEIFKEGQIYGNIQVTRSKEGYVEAILSKSFSFYNYDFIIDEVVYELKGEIKKGDKVGEVRIYKNKELIDTIDILANGSTHKKGIFR